MTQKCIKMRCDETAKAGEERTCVPHGRLRRTDGISGGARLYSSPASDFRRNFAHTLSALLRHTLALYCDILWRFIATYSGALLRHTLALYCDILWRFIATYSSALLRQNSCALLRQNSCALLRQNSCAFLRHNLKLLKISSFS